MEKLWMLKNGVAVVTGAASGIGAGLAEVLAARGVNLALVDRDGQKLEMVAERARAVGVKVSVHVLDVADRSAIAALPQKVLAHHGSVTMLINNAGVALGGSFMQVRAEDFDWLFTINFEAVVRLTRAFLPVMEVRDRGQIVNMSSIFGIIAPPGQTAYSASKFAVRGFSEALRHELRATGSSIGLTLVHPGGVDTSIVENAKLSEQFSPDQVEKGRNAWAATAKISSIEAAEKIVQAIERRQDRLILGKDAERATFLQRLFPVRYWHYIARATGKHGVPLI